MSNWVIRRYILLNPVPFVGVDLEPAVCPDFYRKGNSKIGARNAGMPATSASMPRQNHRPNTNSIDAVEVFFSSGANGMTFCDCREPTSTATYCLPLTA